MLKVQGQYTKGNLIYNVFLRPTEQKEKETYCVIIIMNAKFLTMVLNYYYYISERESDL